MGIAYLLLNPGYISLYVIVFVMFRWGVNELDNEQLQKMTEELSLKFFHKPFRHKAIFNKRLRTIGGRYMLGNHNIEINYRYFEQYGLEEVEGIIKHELCHYHLHLEKKGYKHRDADFKRLLKEVGAPRFCTPLNTPAVNKQKKYYQCTSCHAKFVRKRTVDLNKYVCGICKGKLKKLKIE